MGDYAAQALISVMLANSFPADPIVGEEDAAELRAEEGKVLRERIIELANEALVSPLVEGDKAEWGIGPGQAKTSAELLDAIDRGNYDGGRTGSALAAVRSQFSALNKSQQGCGQSTPLTGPKDSFAASSSRCASPSSSMRRSNSESSAAPTSPSTPQILKASAGAFLSLSEARAATRYHT